MSRRTRMKKQLELQVAKSRIGRAAIANENRRLREAEQRLVEKARNQWLAGDRETAIGTIRRAACIRGGSAQTWHRYGQWLMEVNRADAATEAIQSSLEVDPASLDSVELFIELRYKRYKNYAGVQRVIENMVNHIDLSNASATRGALDFAIPYQVQPALARLERARDVVTRAVVGLHRENATDADTHLLREFEVSDAEERLAFLLFFLNRGRLARAAQVMANLADEELPEASMRRALRRALKKPNPTSGIHVIRHLERIRPKDAWLKSKKAEIAEHTKNTAEYQEQRQLTLNGYPWLNRLGSPAYEVDRSRAFYLLHNSLPYASAGYATRTHGLLTSLTASGRNMMAVTRPGFPFDLSGKEYPAEIAPTETIDGVPYLRLSTSDEKPRKRPLPPYINEYVNRLEPLAIEHRPAIIHAASNHWNGIAAVQLARKLGVVSVYEVRGLWEVTRLSREPDFNRTDQFAFMSKMEASAADGADHVIAITQALKSELVSRGVAEEKITLVPNGVDSTRFRPRARDEELAKRLGIEGKAVIGYVGSLLDYEGLDYLISAAALLRSRRQDFHVLIVGDGAAAHDLRAEVVRAGIEDVVTFTGRVPHSEVEQYYSIIDIAPLPRKPLPVCEMVSPLKPFEAMAMGKVVVASDVAALAEIITPGVNGMLFKKGDIASLASVLENLLDRPGFTADLGRASVDWVRQHRDWRVLSRDVDALYEHLLERSYRP